MDAEQHKLSENRPVLCHGESSTAVDVLVRVVPMSVPLLASTVSCTVWEVVAAGSLSPLSASGQDMELKMVRADD